MPSPVLVSYRASTSVSSLTLGPWYINSGKSQYCTGLLVASVYILVVYYKKCGYLEAVNTCTKLSMIKAAAEVKALPQYAASGEVCIPMYNFKYVYAVILIFLSSLDSGSGSLLMLDKIRQPMPFTLLSLACLEGNIIVQCHVTLTTYVAQPIFCLFIIMLFIFPRLSLLSPCCLIF